MTKNASSRIKTGRAISTSGESVSVRAPTNSAGWSLQQVPFVVGRDLLDTKDASSLSDAEACAIALALHQLLPESTRAGKTTPWHTGARADAVSTRLS